MAHRFTQETGIGYVPRDHLSLPQIKALYGADIVVVVNRRRPAVFHGDGRFFFHQGMAELRILNYSRTGHDPMIAAMGLRPGMSLLDCTVGLASDALVAAFVVGGAGLVKGVESSALVAAIVRHGLQSLGAADANADARRETVESASRIEIICADHLRYLSALPDASVDIVYFDPMFRHPRHASAGIRPLRCFADDRALERESISQALRVCRQRVVLKEARGSVEFNRLGFSTLLGGRYSAVSYGVLERGKGIGPADCDRRADGGG